MIKVEAEDLHTDDNGNDDGSNDVYKLINTCKEA